MTRTAEDLAQEVTALRARTFAQDMEIAKLKGILDQVQHEIDVVERRKVDMVACSALKWALKDRS